MFSCEMCGNGLAINDVKLLDGIDVSLCSDCLEILIEMNQILSPQKMSDLSGMIKSTY